MGWAGRVTKRAAAGSNSGRLAIASGLATAPCSTPQGDMLMRLALQNRQDYARLHGHEVHLMAESVDPRLRMGAWQKLGLMKKVAFQSAGPQALMTIPPYGVLCRHPIPDCRAPLLVWWR